MKYNFFLIVAFSGIIFHQHIAFSCTYKSEAGEWALTYSITFMGLLIPPIYHRNQLPVTQTQQSQWAQTKEMVICGGG